MIDSINKQILGGIIRPRSAEFVVVRTRIHFNKIIDISNIKIAPIKVGIFGLRVDHIGTLNKKKRSMEKSIKGICLSLSSYEQSITISIALLTHFIPPRTIPLLLFNSLLLIFLQAILSFALLIDHPLLLDLHIQTFILILPLLLPLNQPHNPLLCSDQIGLLHPLLNHQSRLIVDSTIELIKRPPRRRLPSHLQLIQPNRIPEMIVKNILLILPDYLPELLDQVRVHLLFVSVIQLIFNHRYRTEMYQVAASTSRVQGLVHSSTDQRSCVRSQVAFQSPFTG